MVSKLHYLPVLLSLLLATAQAQIKTGVYRSPQIHVQPGSVSNKIYTDVDFPRGHIAIKSFDAEIVDDTGKSVPLYETYLHHWIVVKYFAPRANSGLNQSDVIIADISGVCDNTLNQYWGLGSETRKTLTHVPDPYGIVVGDPAKIPAGYEEKWMLNVHVIDTRGTVEPVGCLECRCDLYNATLTRLTNGPLPAGYIGGLQCCTDGNRCKVKEDHTNGRNRTLYLKYTVRYVDWNPTIIPARIYIMDVTDIVTKVNGTNGISHNHSCQVEYDIKLCSTKSKSGCIQTDSLNISLPRGGNLIYGTGHLHVGGLKITLYGQGGRKLCSSSAVYGTGRKPGNEAGYIVGMSTCYPGRGSVKISDGETLTLVSKYSSAKQHTGVMGLFYFLLADS